MKIRVVCPACDVPGMLRAGATAYTCPACDHIISLAEPVPEAAAPLTRCLVCGSSDLFRKKNFPHGLGMLILVGAFLASTVTYLFYHQWLTWVILIGSAAFDGILYLMVGDAICCYRCHAEHLNVEKPESHAPFDLAVHERYRQERLRREELHNRG